VRILITGAAGQLGRDLQDALKPDEIHGLDHSRLDITDRNAVFDAIERVRPAWVINAAAFNDVDGAQTSPAVASAVNGAGPGHLAEAAARTGARLVHLSTDYVFDGLKGSPYTEDDPPNPLSVYGRSKYEGELRVLSSGASACVLRTAWLYGRHGRNFVKSILAAAEKGGPLRVVSDQVGSPTSTADLAAAIGALIRTNAEGVFHTVNAGSCSRFEFARAIVRDRVPVVPISSTEAGRPAPRPANSSLSSVRWHATGLPPLRSWQAALDAFLASD
jgi:dTDP-4-dehydrorhamnose reductase